MPVYMSQEKYLARSLSRFASKVKITDTCHIWTGAVLDSGYGTFGYDGQNFRVHRWIYMIKVGMVDFNNYVLHKCDNKLCVNVDHLFEGTPLDNMLDKVSKNRQAKGSKITISVLREQDIPVIRQRVASGESRLDLAYEYGVSRSAITQLVNRHTWTHVD